MTRRADELLNESLKAAFKLDRRGREAQEIPLYRAAIRMGLRGRALRDAMVCLGSSLRTVGQLTAAKRCSKSALKRFPGDPVVGIFLALVEFDTGEGAAALRRVALMHLAQSSNRGIAAYRGVLRRKFRGLSSSARDAG